MRGITAAALFLITQGALAFDGFEHKDVSNMALQVARNCRRAEMSSQMVEAARRLLDQDERTFGDLTAAADWFQDVTRLTSSTSAWDEIKWRHRRYVKRGLALHRNDRHFQRDALCTYKKLHNQAVALAASAPGNAAEALYSEAVALHFLQDFFAAGHFAVPRTHSHDAVAGSLHDHFNHHGVDIQVNPFRNEEWDALLAAYRQTKSPEKAKLAFQEGDLDDLLARNEPFLIGGDDSLPVSPAHRALILLVSAVSVGEVLSASTRQPALTVDVCFTQRWAEARNEKLLFSQPEPKTYRPPKAAVQLIPGTLPVFTKKLTIADMDHAECARVVSNCERRDGVPLNLASWLASYEMQQDPMSMGEGFYNPKALQLGAATSTSLERRMLNIGWILLARDPRDTVAMREKGEDGRLEETGHNFYDPFVPTIGLFRLALIQGAGYRAVGVDFAGDWEVPHTRFAVTAAGGMRRYSFDAVKWKFDYGLEVTYGVELGSVAMTIESGHARNGRNLQRHTFFMPGFELTLSSSWLRKLFGLAPQTCCPKRSDSPRT